METSTESDSQTGQWMITLRGITGMLFQVGVEKESGGKYSECEFWRSWKHWLC